MDCVSCGTEMVRVPEADAYICPREDCPSHRYDEYKVVK